MHSKCLEFIWMLLQITILILKRNNIYMWIWVHVNTIRTFSYLLFYFYILLVLDIVFDPSVIQLSKLNLFLRRFYSKIHNFPFLRLKFFLSEEGNEKILHFVILYTYFIKGMLHRTTLKETCQHHFSLVKRIPKLPHYSRPFLKLFIHLLSINHYTHILYKQNITPTLKIFFHVSVYKKYI